MLCIWCGCLLPSSPEKEEARLVYRLKFQRFFIVSIFEGKTPRPNVRNPIYETSGDDVYEELPDLLRDKQHEEATYCDVAPPLPSARYDHLPPAPAKLQDHKGEGANGVSINQPSKQNDPSENKKENQLALPSSSSSGALSVGSSEDCYTVMNTAGTVTVMPRSRASGLGTQWGASPSGE